MQPVLLTTEPSLQSTIFYFDFSSWSKVWLWLSESASIRHECELSDDNRCSHQSYHRRCPVQFFLFMKMNEVPLTCSTLNVKSQQKCKAKKNVKNTFHSNECSFIEQREKHQKHKKHKNTADDISGEENFSLFPWRLISSLLGAMCLLLMAATVAVTVSTANLSSERTSPATQQKGLQHPCPENWVWFRCSCYHFSKEELSWRESQLACLSLNSSLIRISREEMDFFHLESFFWVGVYYNGTSKQWQWENHSILSSETFCGFKTGMQEDYCASYTSKETCYPENCANKLKYICKKYHI